MNCVELHESLAENEDGRSAGQRAHLKTCAECSALVAELNLIAATAVDLRAAHEPSPRVWNSIEIALRQEGLIHGPRPSRSLIPAFGSRWGWARWAVPAAAIVLIAVGLRLRPPTTPTIAQIQKPAVVKQTTDPNGGGLNDDDLLQEVAAQSPAMKAQYADNLRRVNDYIKDAKSVVDANPDDEDARRSLMEAYQEKSMLFELAMDRSLP
jgi:hypothetical protein